MASLSREDAQDLIDNFRDAIKELEDAGLKLDIDVQYDRDGFADRVDLDAYHDGDYVDTVKEFDR